MAIRAVSVVALIVAGMMWGSAQAATSAAPINRPLQIVTELPAALLPAKSADETQAIRDARQKWLDKHIVGRTITCNGQVRHVMRPAGFMIVFGLDCPDGTVRGIRVAPTVAALVPFSRVERLWPLKTRHMRVRGTVGSCCIMRTVEKNRSGTPVEIVKLSVEVEDCRILSTTGG